MNVCIPELFTAFEPITSVIGTSNEMDVINNIFQSVPAINFSKFVLEIIPESLCVLEVSDVYWSDWGDEKRIRNDLEKLSLIMVNSVAV